jgi:hypothetical protein
MSVVDIQGIFPACDAPPVSTQWKAKGMPRPEHMRAPHTSPRCLLLPRLEFRVGGQAIEDLRIVERHFFQVGCECARYAPPPADTALLRCCLTVPHPESG